MHEATMKRQLIYTVTPAFDGVKLIDFLIREGKLSRRFCTMASKEKRLRLNQKQVQLGALLRVDDVVTVIIERNESQHIEPEKMELAILFEDEDIIVLNKPPFMLVHPTKNHERGTLANGLMYHFKETGEGEVVRFISRLDRDTSGLILIAKNSFSHMKLAKAMENNHIDKHYLGIIGGWMIPREGTINLPIGKQQESDIRRCVIESGQVSITHYVTLRSFDYGSLLEFELITGRTHQIRVHLSALGQSLIGDELYGTDASAQSFELGSSEHLKVYCMQRQALHASRLQFPHPRTEEVLVFTATLPPDMEEQLRRLGTEWEK